MTSLHPALVTTLTVVALALVALGGPVDPAVAQTKDRVPVEGPKAENLSARGASLWFLPLADGAYRELREPEFRDGEDAGAYRKDVRVLDETMELDLPSIGKFEAAIVRETEILDGEELARADRYCAIDTVTGAVWLFGETVWEDGRSESWRAGEPAAFGIAEPGLLVPAAFSSGGKYVVEGREEKPLVVAEVVETGVTIETPAGTFDDCVRVREHDLVDAEDTVEKCYCRGVGLVSESPGGKLASGSALPKAGRVPGGRSKSVPESTLSAAPSRKITDEEARKIAVAAVPGEVMDIAVERKLGAKRIVVEVIANEDLAETDVIIDMMTGEVLGIEK